MAALLLRNRLSVSLAITDPMVDVNAESTPIEQDIAEIGNTFSATGIWRRP